MGIFSSCLRGSRNRDSRRGNAQETLNRRQPIVINVRELHEIEDYSQSSITAGHHNIHTSSYLHTMMLQSQNSQANNASTTTFRRRSRFRMKTLDSFVLNRSKEPSIQDEVASNNSSRDESRDYLPSMRVKFKGMFSPIAASANNSGKTESVNDFSGGSNMMSPFGTQYNSPDVNKQRFEFAIARQDRIDVSPQENSSIPPLEQSDLQIRKNLHEQTFRETLQRLQSASSPPRSRVPSRSGNE
jgi:hypothetical protein